VAAHFSGIVLPRQSGMSAVHTRMLPIRPTAAWLARWFANGLGLLAWQLRGCAVLEKAILLDLQRRRWLTGCQDRLPCCLESGQTCMSAGLLV